MESLEKFRDGEVDYLLCTDVAARGLDIAGITTVINASMPHSFKQYIHRVGRTARAGRNGRSVTLVGESDRKLLKEAVKNARDKVKKRTVPADVMEKYGMKIINFESQIDEIMKEEKEETIVSTRALMFCLWFDCTPFNAGSISSGKRKWKPPRLRTSSSTRRKS